MTRPLSRFGWCSCLALAPVLGAVPAAWADAAEPAASTEPPQRRLNYVLGAIVGSGPAYPGSATRSNSLRPAWALEYGRFRLSTSRGSALMGHGLAAEESGASATLRQSDRFRLSAALRMDGGRDAGDAPRLAGLPEIRRTLRGRLSAGYELADRWSVGLSLSQDLLGREGGAQMSAGLGYTWPVSQQTKVVVSSSASFGNSTYMRAHYAVPAGSASPLPAFEASAGLYALDLGLDVTHALSRHWVVVGGVRMSQVQGDARRSPLTERGTGFSVSLGLAYRCCR